MKRFSRFASLLSVFVLMAFTLTACITVGAKFCVEPPDMVKGYLSDKLQGGCPLDFNYTNKSNAPQKQAMLQLQILPVTYQSPVDLKEQVSMRPHTVGTRLEDGNHYDSLPGSYWKDPKGQWWVHVPLKEAVGASRLVGWDIVEHADRTITVSPSIHVVGKWHGFLKAGVFETLGDYPGELV